MKNKGEEVKKIILIMAIFASALSANIDSCAAAIYELDALLKLNKFYGAAYKVGYPRFIPNDLDAAKNVMIECGYRDTPRARSFKAKARRVLYWDQYLKMYDGKRSWLYGEVKASCWNLLRSAQIMDKVLRPHYKAGEAVTYSSTRLLKELAVDASTACEKIRDYGSMDKAQLIYNVYERY